MPRGRQQALYFKKWKTHASRQPAGFYEDGAVHLGAKLRLLAEPFIGAPRWILSELAQLLKGSGLEFLDYAD
jgi:hypothetical protein